MSANVDNHQDLMTSAVAGYVGDKNHRPNLFADRLTELIALARSSNESQLASCLLILTLARDAGRLELGICEAALKHALARIAIDLPFAQPESIRIP